MNTDVNQVDTQQRISKREQQSMILLICEIVVYILTNISYSLVLTYSTITAKQFKTMEQIHIELFISYLSSPFLILINNCSLFYLYLIVSSKFRKDLKQLFHCCYH